MNFKRSENSFVSAVVTVWTVLMDFKGTMTGVVVTSLATALFDGSTAGVVLLGMDALVIGSDTLFETVPILSASIQSIEDRYGLTGLFAGFLLAAVIGQILRSGFQFLSYAGGIKLQILVYQRMLQRLMRQFMGMDYSTFSGYQLGDIISLQTDASNFGSFVVQLTGFLSMLIAVIVFAAVLFLISWPLSLAALILLGLLSFGARSIFLRVRRYSQEFTNARVKLSTRMTQALQGMRLVRSFAQEDYILSRFDRAVEDHHRSQVQGLTWEYALTPIIEIAAIMVLVGLLIAGLLVVDTNSLRGAVPQIASFVYILYRLLPRVRNLNAFVGQMIKFSPSVNRIETFFAEQQIPLPTLADDEANVPEIVQQIEFRTVSMQYGVEDDHALQDINLLVQRGEVMAVVGRSGAGKSTLVDLLLRLYEPGSGTILVNGGDIREMAVHTWRERIGVVSQDSFLFNASIRENILFGKLEATEDDLVRAAEAAYITEFIDLLPDGFDTIIGESGERLSGGQRQRIALARAFIRNPAILILDEATNSLDRESELMIQASINKMREGRIVVIVTHRLASITDADQIIVLDKGRIIDKGTHQELLARDGYYALLWALQASDRDDR